MAVTPRIFISATSGDLKSHRATVAAALKKLETYAEVQDDWPHDYRTVEQMLRRRIKDSDAVIHIVGLRYGAEPRDVPPGIPRRSYTQMEYHIARELNKPVYLFLLPDTFPYDDSAPEEDEEKRSLQQAHRALIKADAHLHASPSETASLEKEILALGPVLNYLKAAKEKGRQLGCTIAITFALMISSGTWFLLQGRPNQLTNLTEAVTIPNHVEDLSKPESVEVKYLKEIQILRSQNVTAPGNLAGGMSYTDSLASVARDHGLTADILRAQLDAFAAKVLADPDADAYGRAIAEYHKQNYAAAAAIATAALVAAENETQAQRNKAIEGWTLVGESEKAQGSYDAALAAYQKALAFADKAGTPKRWCDLAINVADTLRSMAQWKEAEALYREILALREANFGKNAPEIAEALGKLAHLLQATNRFAEAEPILRRALVIDERALGQDHPKVASNLNNLGQLFKDTNRLKEAEEFMRRALAIDEKTFGPEHPNVSSGLSSLALFLHDTNRSVEAEKMMRQALEIDEKTLGSNHPTVALRLFLLAGLLKGTNQLAEAEPLMRRALDITVSGSAKNGVVDPGLASYSNYYRRLLVRMGDTEEQAREKVRKILTPEGVKSEALEKVREEVLGK